jgi:hypothetical protein
VKPLLRKVLCGDSTPYQAADELVQALSQAGEKQKVERGERLFSLGEQAKGVQRFPECRGGN